MGQILQEGAGTIFRLIHYMFEHNKIKAPKEAHVLSTIIIILLVLFVIGALPNWNHSANWGYGPSGGLGLVLVIVVILLLMGKI